jgi:hypothetical protein
MYTKKNNFEYIQCKLGSKTFSMIKHTKYVPKGSEYLKDTEIKSITKVKRVSKKCV